MEQTRKPDVIEPGLYQMSLVKGGWKVPCRIICEDGLWTGEVDEVATTPVSDPFHSSVIVRIHEWAEKIGHRKYVWLISVKRHAKEHANYHPCLDPWRAMDPMNLPPLIPRRKEWTPG